MRSLAAGALALLAGGCLKAEVTVCKDGAICPTGYACTDQDSLCGPTLQVEACKGRGPFGACNYQGDNDPMMQAGTCHSGICDRCEVDLAGCHYDDWMSMTSPVTENLYVISAHSFVDVDVAGARGTLLHYDGFRWTKSSAFETLAGASDGVGLFKAADGTRLAATSSGDFLRSPPDSDAWERIAMTGKSLTSMSAASNADVVAVGPAGEIVELAGSTPTFPTSPGFGLNAVWVSATGDAFAVGVRSGVLQRKNGTWTVLRSPVSGDPELLAVWGRAANDVYMVGTPQTTQPTILHYDGTTVTLVSPPAGVVSPVALRAVWGTETDLWFAGDGGSVVHYDGHDWVQRSPTDVILHDIAAGDSDVFAVGVGGKIVRLTQ